MCTCLLRYKKCVRVLCALGVQVFWWFFREVSSHGGGDLGKSFGVNCNMVLYRQNKQVWCRWIVF